MNEQPMTKLNASYPEIKDISNDFQSLKEDIGHLGTHIKKDGMKDLSNASADACSSMKKMGQRI